MIIRDVIKNLLNFPIDSHVEVCEGSICIITNDTYNGEHLFDLDTAPESLPDFNDPDLDDDYLEGFTEVDTDEESYEEDFDIE